MQRPLAAVSALALCLTACARGGSAGSGPPPPDVEVVTLAPRTVERSSAHLGTVRSRSSTTVQPQVEGLVETIAVRSGQRVRPGDFLFQIDDDRQHAVVASLESLRVAREADLDYARQQAERQRLLLQAGAVSEQEQEQAATAARTASAQLQAVEEQIREAAVELAYHRVAAPAGGTVGDVPVRVGDRVTPATVLTTIDSSAELELTIHVPVAQAQALRAGLPVRIAGDGGATLETTALDFVSPEVDARTQAVMVKAPLGRESVLRSGQIVRAHIVWEEQPALTVPVTAVSRISGRHFAFVAEEQQGRTVARQRLLGVGPIVGGEYLVVEGLAAGERLIVSGTQKVRDGAPVHVVAPATPGAARG
jgi:RND family efflux transporter MFP subunit